MSSARQTAAAGLAWQPVGKSPPLPPKWNENSTANYMLTWHHEFQVPIPASPRQIPVASIRWHKQGGLSQAVDSPWATGSRGVERLLVEWRGPFMGGTLARPAAERRLDELCELLRAMHGADRDDKLDRGCANPARSAVDFAKLQCIGWTLASEPSFAHVGIVFRYPPCHHGALPRSLLDHISASRSLHARRWAGASNSRWLSPAP